MASFTPTNELFAAILSDEVYHSQGETINLPASSGWVPITSTYDAATGYYAEAWGQVDPSNPGQYLQIMQVNRGTVFSEPDSNATFMGASSAISRMITSCIMRRASTFIAAVVV